MKDNYNSTTKTKKKNFLGSILQDITPWNHKKTRNCYVHGYFGGLETNVEFYRFLWYSDLLKVSACIFWLTTVITLNYIFSLILNIFQRVSSEKTLCIQITIMPGDIDGKKARKTFHKVHIKVFLNASLWIFPCY